MPAQVSSPWIAVVPGEEYRLEAHPKTKWGSWSLVKENATWILVGPGFDKFGLDNMTVSIAHWYAFLMIVVFLEREEADPVAAIPLTKERRKTDE